MADAETRLQGLESRMEQMEAQVRAQREQLENLHRQLGLTLNALLLPDTYEYTSLSLPTPPLPHG